MKVQSNNGTDYYADPARERPVASERRIVNTFELLRKTLLYITGAAVGLAGVGIATTPLPDTAPTQTAPTMLPKTGSQLPLLGILGFLAFLSGLGLRGARQRA